MYGCVHGKARYPVRKLRDLDPPRAFRLSYQRLGADKLERIHEAITLASRFISILLYFIISFISKIYTSINLNVDFLYQRYSYNIFF